MQFSLGVRLYRIKSVNSQSDSFSRITNDDGSQFLTDDSGANFLGTDGISFNLTVWPPIRETVPNLSPVNFAAPVCICRLKTYLEMRSAGDDYAGRALGKVSFEEAINV
jgi:hypothetical protein